MGSLIRILKSAGPAVIAWLRARPAVLSRWAEKIGLRISGLAPLDAATRIFNKVVRNPVLAAIFVYELADEGFELAATWLAQAFEEEGVDVDQRDSEMQSIAAAHTALFASPPAALPDDRLQSDPNTGEDVAQLESFVTLKKDMDFAVSFFGGEERLKRVLRALAATPEDWSLRQAIRSMS